MHHCLPSPPITPESYRLPLVKAELGKEEAAAAVPKATGTLDMANASIHEIENMDDDHED